MKLINMVYAMSLLLASLWFTSQLDTFGLFVGTTGFLCVSGVIMKKKWGYFAAGIWCAGLMRLSIDKYSGVYEDSIKHTVTALGFFGVVFAIILHETLTKTSKKAESKSKNTPTDSSSH
ncbi:hypothetical protein [Marinibactrum halimedae]|uniref:hypothetical protein n=1 Tax=Marinibactrum halimedae TaxID=1444977 RepID=UPI001E2DB803|nr:hypothetical protein [Marinibactrum halimedae]MCD9457725.1 hypothetical protein [Marinibactrum halimedae]